MLPGPPSQNFRCATAIWHRREVVHSGLGRSRGTGELHEQIGQTPLTLSTCLWPHGVFLMTHLLKKNKLKPGLWMNLYVAIKQWMTVDYSPTQEESWKTVKTNLPVWQNSWVWHVRTRSCPHHLGLKFESTLTHAQLLMVWLGGWWIRRKRMEDLWHGNMLTRFSESSQTTKILSPMSFERQSL